MAEYLIQEDTLNRMANVVREKAGVDNQMTPEEIIEEIYMLETSTDTGAPAHGVTFYDYDGTVLYSYTIKEARALTALPELPTHEGVTPYGWTCTLDEVHSTLKTLDVGAIYESDTSQLTIDIAEDNLTFTTYFKATVAGGVVIDWGDGNTTSTTSTSRTGYSHTYAVAGTYCVKYQIVDGNLVIDPTSQDDTYWWGVADECYRVKSAVISGNTKFNYVLTTVKKCATFYNCQYLQSVMICNGVTRMYGDAFIFCRALKCIIFPSSATYLDYRMFYGCSALTTVILPKEMMLDNYSSTYAIFSSCTALKRLVIPNGITTFDDFLVQHSSSLRELYFRSTTPPTINSNTLLEPSSFGALPTQCKIYVPLGSVEEYRNAEYWSSYASCIYGTPF